MEFRGLIFVLLLESFFFINCEAQASVSKPLSLTTAAALGTRTSSSGNVSLVLADDHKPETVSVRLNSESSVNSCDKLKVSSYAVCSSGNRMYRLLKYDVNQENILSECYKACNESYSTANDLISCEVGCRAGVQNDEQRQAEMVNFRSQAYSLLNQARMQQMFSHWMFEMLAGFDMFNDWYDSELNTETANTVSTYIIVEQIDDQLKISSYQFDRVKLTTDSSTGMPDEVGPVNPYVESKNKKFESCYSAISYPRLIVCLLLMSSGVFLVWLICSTVKTAPKQRLRPESLSQEELEDKKILLKVMVAKNSLGPVPVHTKKSPEDDKMLLA
ncbi:hypothetical protein EB796_008689 [Bugula neritina]|uniref:Uncharacterized protein n=1 Tax=Bugula neritina TaxID=10212 RepID=A0A7J7K445_BUGNE|nr:hypothetical protein EB796_008689 [Bugula neritina]